jgi:hypothetical protein
MVDAWKPFFIGMLAILFFVFVAVTFPTILTGFSNAGTFSIGDLFVQAGVLLAIDGTSATQVSWPVGTYSECTISTVSTNCLNAQVTNQPVISPFWTLFALIAVFFVIIFMLILAKRANE